MVNVSAARRASAIALLAAALCACAEGGGGGETSQVVVRVNESEITVSQLRTALLTKGQPQPTADATQQAIDGLVNEQLLVDAALANDLDRDPAVVQATESARRQLLVRAYLERDVFPKEEVSATDQAAYYKSNPALFAHRRVYQIATFRIAGELSPEVVKDLGSATDVETVTAALTTHHVPFDVQNLTRAAEQLPLEQLPRFASADVGDIVIDGSAGRGPALMLITGVQDAPLGFEMAQPIIQQYLLNVRNAEALDGHLKLARAAANINQSDQALLVATADPVSAPVPPEGPVDHLQRGTAILD
jgi:EpsD family peptidyl-prolyl cis-trans isomerase